MNGISPQDDLTGGVTLDSLFRANVSARPAAIAAIDPPDRADFTDGSAQRLTYAEMDARVEAVARALQSFGMPARSVVAIQLPHIVEAAISLLATARAGYVAAPVPVLWRRSDLVASLAGLGPSASIALARLHDERPAEIFCETAAELFDLSFPCAFGADVPDGVLPLDRYTADAAGAPFATGANDVSIVTFDADPEGFFATGRSDAQWLAAGLATLLEARIETADTIVTTLPFHTLAGIGAAFVPWLLSGGTLQFMPGAPHGFPSGQAGTRTHLVAPAAVLTEFARGEGAKFSSCVAVHRLPATYGLDFSAVQSEHTVDLYSFGEIGMVPLAREEVRTALSIPAGPISAPTGAVDAPMVIETRLASGQVWLRGPMVPRQAYPAGLGSFRTARDADGFVRTGFACRSDGNGGIVVEAGPDRVISVGGLRFGLDDLQSRFSACAGSINLTAVEDPLLGQRLRVEAEDREAAAAALLAAGHSQLAIDAAMGPSRRQRIG